MVRAGLAGLTAILLASAAPAVAAPGDDTPAEVMRDCGGDSLPRDEVSSCLERARVLDQSSPSPELQSLEARLEQRIKGDPDDANAPPPSRYDQMGADDDQPPPPDEDSGNGSPDDEMGPNDRPPSDEDSGQDDQGPPDENSGPDDQPPPPDAGSWDDDEPPVDDGEDGYDNSQPDPGYDTPDAPDDDQGPPPPDDDDAYDSGQG